MTQHPGCKPEAEGRAEAPVLGVGRALHLSVTVVGAAADNEKTSSSRCQRILCHAGAAVVREARRGCCVMLEAQLADSSNSQECASAGSIGVS